MFKFSSEAALNIPQEQHKFCLDWMSFQRKNNIHTKYFYIVSLTTYSSKAKSDKTVFSYPCKILRKSAQISLLFKDQYHMKYKNIFVLHNINIKYIIYLKYHNIL